MAQHDTVRQPSPMDSKRLSLKGFHVSLSDTFWDSHIFV